MGLDLQLVFPVNASMMLVSRRESSRSSETSLSNNAVAYRLFGTRGAGTCWPSVEIGSGLSIVVLLLRELPFGSGSTAKFTGAISPVGCGALYVLDAALLFGFAMSGREPVCNTSQGFGPKYRL